MLGNKDAAGMEDSKGMEATDEGGKLRAWLKEALAGHTEGRPLPGPQSEEAASDKGAIAAIVEHLHHIRSLPRAQPGGQRSGAANDNDVPDDNGVPPHPDPEALRAILDGVLPFSVDELIRNNGHLQAITAAYTCLAARRALPPQEAFSLSQYGVRSRPLCHIILLAIDDLAVEAEKSAQVLHEAQQLSRSATSLCNTIRKRLEPSTLGALDDLNRCSRPFYEQEVARLHAATETVIAKQEEYRERIAMRPTSVVIEDQRGAAEAGDAGPILGAHGRIVERCNELLATRREIEALTASLASYGALPPDLALAQAEVDRARRELDALTVERDTLLRRMH